jgi:hypothetical protein
MAQVNGLHIKMNVWDAFIHNTFWGRLIPRNNYEFSNFIIALIIEILALPVLWALMHVPFIWPEMLGGFIGILCILTLVKPYIDPFRAFFVLILASSFLYFKITFGAEVFGLHIEKFLYFAAIFSACLALWRRFWNFFAWYQIDRICNKYSIPRIDQKKLMDAYEGNDTHYGERPKQYATYQDALKAELAKKNITGEIT